MHFLSRLALVVLAGAAILLAKKATRQQASFELTPAARPHVLYQPRSAAALRQLASPAPPLPGSALTTRPYPRWLFLSDYLQVSQLQSFSSYQLAPGALRPLGLPEASRPL